MSQESRRQLVQIIALIVLLAALGFSVWYNFLKPQKKAEPEVVQRPPAAQPADSAAPADGTAPPPKYGTTETQKAVEQTGADASKPAAPSENGTVQLDINPSQFKVYALSPPRNPFLREESWYSETLNELPGYPELRDNGYFESMDAVIPDVEKYFGDKDWSSVSLTRQQTPPTYNIQGTSKDGSISTSIELNEPAEPPVSVRWDAESGIPLSALRTPGWQDRYGSAEAGAAEQGAADGSAAAASDGGGLGIPRADAAAAGAGDVISLSGVNFRGPAASALIIYNGTPYLVAEGSVLPTHYQVLAIKPDGVVLLEMRSGDSEWVPLGLPAPAAK